MCETSPQIQCSHCLTYWAKSIVYCTCGTCLYLTEKTRKIERWSIRCTVDSTLRDKERPISWRASLGHIYHAAHVATQKGKKETVLFNFGSISKMLDLQRVTTRDWMGWRLLPILRRSLKWRWYIFLYCKWTSTTWKQLGIGTEQPRSEWSDETTRRLRRSRQNQRSFAQRIWTSQPKNTSHQTSITKSESTILKIQWRSRTSWSHNRLEMVSIYHLIKFIFNMADINKWVVPSIELGCTVIFLFIPKLRRFLFEAMTIPCDRQEVQTPHYICVHLHIPHTWTFLASLTWRSYIQGVPPHKGFMLAKAVWQANFLFHAHLAAHSRCVLFPTFHRLRIEVALITFLGRQSFGEGLKSWFLLSLVSPGWGLFPLVRVVQSKKKHLFRACDVLQNWHLYIGFEGNSLIGSAPILVSPHPSTTDKIGFTSTGACTKHWLPSTGYACIRRRDRVSATAEDFCPSPSCQSGCGNFPLKTWP